MKSSKVLIMIPAYNCEKFISRTLDSCLAQTVQTEVWVVDNCSTDKTRDIVQTYHKKFPLIKLLVNKTNLGRVGNWNRCLELFEKSDFEFIKFVFSGDEILAQCIEKVEEAYKIDKNIGAVVFPYLFVRENGKVSRDTNRRGNRLFSVKEIIDINLREGGLLGAIIADTYNKKFIRGMRFNELFMGKSDFDFAVLAKSKAYYIDQVLARYNVDAHRTLKASQDYFFQTEITYNRAYWLEKLKGNYSESEYKNIKEIVMHESIIGSANYFGIASFLKLFYKLFLRLLEKYYVGLLSQSRNVIPFKR